MKRIIGIAMVIGLWNGLLHRCSADMSWLRADMSISLTPYEYIILK